MSARGFAVGRDARPLRFLLLCVGGWTVLRVAAHWNPDVPPPPKAVAPPWSAPIPFAATGRSFERAAPAAWAAAPRSPRMGLRPSVRAAGGRAIGDVALATADAVGTGGAGGADRHGLRAALLARLLPPSASVAARSAMPRGAADWFPAAATASAAPGQGRPFWMRRQMAGWLLGGWVYLRGGALVAPGGIAAASQLGGSQAGLRLAYGFGDSGRVRAYGRATVALRRPEQRELAFGLAFAPVAHWPVDVAVEQRAAVGKGGARRWLRWSAAASAMSCCRMGSGLKLMGRRASSGRGAATALPMGRL